MRLRRIGITLSLGGSIGAALVGWAGCSSERVATLDVATEAAPATEPPSRDAASTKAAEGGATREGGCAAVGGECDVVLQDCPDRAGAKQECVVRPSGDAFVTRCVPVQASQRLPMGRSCCPGADNPCLPGLTCVGAPCVDGGPITARCTPACCDGDHASCERSDPEGIGGQCDVVLYAGATPLHGVCSYRERCKPFGVEPCRADQACIIEDSVGTAGCMASRGAKLREPCRFANDCADGLVCIGAGDARSCRMYCLTPNSNPSFDASAATGEPGRGGCPANETCTGPGISNMPDWIQLCELPDGG